ncbi:NAD-dependent epimerase/dehydratase family protein [Pseudothermotoga lettingae]|jgi:dihydroflavonol-4-reductase|uniref:NAD-dependent epimerase/dehydratase n=2 Tax=Pseudothermotoga TaxID=1643951 RepID=A8F3Z8_PSELT|nr:NAD-dependent epimerase/dehydratase family protein [Pseudothermotoga lettingae]ABV32882.1 NAD-dependent epimerase/dehydratase [Pseudothermotoga lettingae TMO]MDI3494053.1 hypothetical protein [Pseudothermotoga sp.]GLI48120.1 epimerase [Pseudothermotoga lettingae TMO]
MILVTGSTGHLGNVLVRFLVARGYSVKAMVAPFEDTKPIENLPLQIVQGDIRDHDFVVNSSKDVEAVFHLAATISILGKKKTVYDVNVNGTKNVISACIKNKIGKLVYVSSIHAFSDQKPGSLIDESIPIDPKKVKGDYAKSKAMATLEVLKASKEAIDTVVICPTGIIGPYDWRISEMGKLLILYSKGLLKVGVDGSFDFVDVRDVANVLISAYEKNEWGEIFIASGHHTTVRALIQMLEKIRKKRSVNVFLSKYIAYPISLLTALYYFAAKKRPLLTPYSVYTLSRNYIYSNKKASEKLGYNPRNLQESLKDAIQWFEDNGYLKPANGNLRKNTRMHLSLDK